MLLCLKLCDNGLFSKMLNTYFCPINSPLPLPFCMLHLHLNICQKQGATQQQQKKSNRRINEILEGKSLCIFLCFDIKKNIGIQRDIVMKYILNLFNSCRIISTLLKKIFFLNKIKKTNRREMGKTEIKKEKRGN